MIVLAYYFLIHLWKYKQLHIVCQIIISKFGITTFGVNVTGPTRNLTANKRSASNPSVTRPTPLYSSQDPIPEWLARENERLGNSISNFLLSYMALYIMSDKDRHIYPKWEKI